MNFIHNILSIDLESWVHFYVDALRLSEAELPSQRRQMLDNGYLERATHYTLELLARYEQTATFFIVGETSSWNPGLIRTVAESGHEIAYHTHDHRVVRDAASLQRQLGQSRPFLEEFQPVGYRAPQLKMSPDCYPILAEHGFRYSSSTYGVRSFIAHNNLVELPVSSIRFRKKARVDDRWPMDLNLRRLASEVPFGSGLFVGLLGANTSGLIRRLNENGQQTVLFVHPWQYVKVPEISTRSFYWRVARRNPAALLYSIDLHNAFKTLLSRFRFSSFQETFR